MKYFRYEIFAIYSIETYQLVRTWHGLVQCPSHREVERQSPSNKRVITISLVELIAQLYKATQIKLIVSQARPHRIFHPAWGFF